MIISTVYKTIDREMAGREPHGSDSDGSDFDVEEYFRESVPTTKAVSELPVSRPVISAPTPTVTSTQVRKPLFISPLT